MGYVFEFDLSEFFMFWGRGIFFDVMWVIYKFIFCFFKFNCLRNE